MATASGSCLLSGSGTSASRRPGANASSCRSFDRYEAPATFTTRMRGSRCDSASPVAALRSQYPDSPGSSQILSRSELEESPDCIRHPLDRRHVRVLDLPVRIRDVEPGHAQHRAAQVEG